MSDQSDDSLALLEFIVDRVNVGVLVVNQELEVVRWNRFMEMNSGRSVAEVLGRNLFDSFPELPQRWLEKKIRSVFILKNFAFTSWEQRPYLFRFRHNRPVTGGVDYMHQNCTFLPIKDAAEDVRYVCITVFDVTDIAIYQKMLKDAMSSLEEMSVRDGLTGVYNRRHLETCLTTEIARAERHQVPLSVLMFDIDFFKKVNDTYGHQAGDEVLKAVAERTQSILRSSDVCGRYGGEEFTVLLPNTDLQGAGQMGERLRRIISDKPVPARELSIPVTVSVGASTLRHAGTALELMLKEADVALYRAKAAGRDRVVLFHPAAD